MSDRSPSSRSSCRRSLVAALAAAAVVAATLVVAGPPAGASVTFDPAITLALNSSTPEIAATLDGRVVAALPGFPTSAFTDDQDRLRVAWRSTSGSWGPSSELTSSTNLGSWDVAATPEGTGVVGWTEVSGGTYRVRVSTSTGSAWSAPTDLASSTVPQQDVRLAAGPGGTVMALWSTDPLATKSVRVSVLDDGSWSAPATLASGVAQHDVAVGPGSTAVAVWQRSATPTRVEARWWSGGAWGPIETLSDPTSEAGEPAPVVLPSGQALVVWEAGTLGGTVISSATRTSSGWTSPVLLAPGAFFADAGDLAASPDGTASYVWTRGDDFASIQVQVSTWDGGWDTPVPVGATGSAESAIAIGPDGTAAVAIGRTSPDRVEVAVRPPGGAWGTPTVVSAPGPVGDPAVAVAPAGRLAVLYGVISDPLLINPPTDLLAVSGTIAGVSPPGPFADVPAGAFFTAPVQWARDVGYTTGVGGANAFEPDRSITRAELVTLLWRIAGEPGAVASGFADVPAGTFFSTAVGWARATGLTTGVGGANVFEPNRDITRAEVVTLLWRQAGELASTAPAFDDVAPGTFFTAAVAWARAIGLTTGVGGANVFEPNRSITRGEAITLLYRLVADATFQASELSAAPSG